MCIRTRCCSSPGCFMLQGARVPILGPCLCRLVGDCQGTLSVVELLEDRKLKILDYNVPFEASLSEC